MFLNFHIRYNHHLLSDIIEFHSSDEDHQEDFTNLESHVDESNFTIYISEDHEFNKGIP